ncbi:hypothetical protein J2S43_001448 [Catenuloplanes nepalensis]|uniref:Uncharacterized protein n=1 Tax=Catenuloplanes nepalensis TaxID=587533 RepID=A0ABT9MPE9_9ACTN|nr:hypothetical protein [Catenuloplanes nepalensis]MDP9792936.1 hypothetical protein [Catenuloplanes nepalensis]
MLTDPDSPRTGWTLSTCVAGAESAEAAHRAGAPCSPRCAGDGCPIPQGLRSGALLAASLIIDTHAAGIDCDENCGGDDACDRLDEALALMVAEQELYRVLDV